MFGTSGVRGPVGETVTADLALDVGRAVGVDADRVVVGRDPRESGRFLTDALAAGLAESGTDVVDLGLAATPTVARAVGWEGADAGVSVTASHNPPTDNGLKLWQPSGQAYDATLRERVTERVREGTTDPAAWDGVGERTTADATARHVAALVEAVDLPEPPSVVVDLGNGAGGVTVRALRELGCAVETLNAQPDGAFPGRPSEPTAEHCASLCALVRASDADLGLAHDGDADRLLAVTDEGDFLAGDVLLALFAREAAAAGETVAAPINTSLAVDDHLAAADVAVRRTPVGDVHVAAAAAEAGVPLGGEPSGAWVWPDATLCPDGPLAACKLVALTAERPLAARAAEVETYPLRRASVETDRKGAVVEAVRERVRADYPNADVSTLDGVRVETDEGWLLVRASGTQPLVRLTAEGRNEAAADRLRSEARSLVEAAREGDPG